MSNKQHILLVEDDEALQELIKKLLTNNEYIVSIAKNIQEAEKLLQLFLFDLIILDVMLPDISGREICRKIKADDQLKNISIIMLTAKGDEVDRIVGFEITPLLWSKFNTNVTLSAGRVQSVAVRLIVEREKEILYCRRLSDDPTTLEDLSKKFKISRERIRQIENKAFEKLQKHMLNAAKSKNLLPIN